MSKTYRKVRDRELLASNRVVKHSFNSKGKDIHTRQHSCNFNKNRYHSVTYIMDRASLKLAKYSNINVNEMVGPYD